MMRKKRGYKREAYGLKRDYRLFAIACEGKREADYFRFLESISRGIAIDIIEEVVPDSEMQVKHSNKSAPKWLLDRAVRYIEKEGLDDEDELWFVLDVDKWKNEQIREIAEYCRQKPNWHIAISNPCFEVWLYYHINASVPGNLKSSNKCKDWKQALNSKSKGGYSKESYLMLIKEAIVNASNADTDKAHYFPDTGQTKVYLLAEAIMKRVGINEFMEFIQSLQ